MGRTYIDRERLEVVGYQGVPEGYENTFDCGVMWLLEQIDEMPSADVVEVVRCKDCIHAEHWYGDKSRCFLWHEDGIDVFDDGYCSYGERKDG